MRSRAVAAVGGAIAAVAVGAAVVLIPHHPTVLLVGDSLLKESAPEAVHELHAAGFRVDVRAVPGAGLLSSRFDFAADAGRLVTRDRPQLVVVELAGDYEPPYQPGILPYTQAFYQAWTDATHRLLTVLMTHGAAVELVLLPPMRDPQLDASASALNGIYAALARSTQRVGCIDGHAPLADPAGRFAEMLPGAGGAAELVRTFDGVHLAAAGARRLGHAIAQGARDASSGNPDGCPL